MAAILMDGKALAAACRLRYTKEAADLVSRGTVPHLAAVLVGEDPASLIYVRNKERACEAAGIRSTTVRLPADCGQGRLEETVSRLNADEMVHGILVQLPLPAELNASQVLCLIDPKKDVDGFHAMNTGLLWRGEPCMVPCTPLGILRLLDEYKIDPKGKNAVVVGRSNIVGKPVAALLLARNATVTVCHSRTSDLAAHTRQADILIAAVGRPHLITGDMVRDGAAVIDVGINRANGKLTGDVDEDSVSRKAGWLTPVPGGVGPMTIAMLLHNTLQAAQRHAR